MGRALIGPQATLVARGTWPASLSTVRKAAYVEVGPQEYEILS